MSKIKKQIIFFVLIVIVGICYSINTYIITPQKLVIEQKAKQVQEYTQKLKLLKGKSSEVISLTSEVTKLKQASNSLSDVTVKDINTPQLIYDFYTSCTEYEIKGEDLVFQLADSSSKSGSPTSGTTSNSDNSTTSQSASNNQSTTNNNNQGANINQTTVNAQTNAVANKTDNTTSAKPATDLLKLTIELKVSGNKNNMEKYIRNLNVLTLRKINVQSIKLEATKATVSQNSAANTNGVENPQINPSPIVSPETETIAEPVTDQVTADIIFNQYIYTKDKDIIRPSGYSFYDEKTGFSNFSDMFK